MLRWSVIFFLIALVSALFGFTRIAADAVAFSKILFVIFLVLFLVSLLVPIFKKKSAQSQKKETIGEKNI